MEEILFDGYRKYLKEREDNVVKAFFKMPLAAKFLLVGIVLCVVLNAFIVVFSKNACIGALLLLVEVVLCIVTYFYVENYQIRMSDVRVMDYKNHCQSLVEWLVSNDIEISRTNMTELRDRVLAVIAEKEKARKEGVERVEKWIQTLIIPLLLAVVAKIINEQTDLSVVIGVVIVLVIAFGSVCATVIYCYNIVSFFRKRKLEQMKKLASDIQGIIDTQLDDGLIRKVKLKTSV